MAGRMGQWERAALWLQAAVPGLLEEGEVYDAAVAAVDLAEVSVRSGDTAALARLPETLAPLLARGALPEPARSALLSALLAAERQDPGAAHRLAAAGELLERFRENPRPRFREAAEPTEPKET